SRHSIGPRLGRRDGSPYWYIVWADGAGRLKRRSTGQTDRAAAETALAAFLLERGLSDSPSVVALLESYEADRAPHVAAADRIGYAVARLSEHFALSTVE